MYEKVVEEIPKDVSDPLGNEDVTTTFLDANLVHDVPTGRSVMRYRTREPDYSHLPIQEYE